MLSVMDQMANQDGIRELMRWYVDAGVDETIVDIAIDRFAETQELKALKQSALKQTNISQPTSPTIFPSNKARHPTPSTPQIGAEAAMHDAVHLAASASTVDELYSVVENFEGCPLKKTASNLVFLDGNRESRILIIGGAPGADEDRQGVPFSGQNGLLFDKMMASIGLDRSQVLIAGIVFWRPPGNRSPTQAEISVCMPFVERLIEIVDPHVVLAMGESSAKVLLAQKKAIGRLRGKWNEYSLPGLPRPINLLAMNSPNVLLNSPIQKRDAWHDLLLLKKKLSEFE